MFHRLVRSQSTPSRNRPALPPVGHSPRRRTLPPTPVHNHRFVSGASDCPLNGPDDGHQCRLPECFCSRTGLDIPGGLSPGDVPRMVLLTFHGPVNDQNINILKSLFNGRLRNPNGCPIGATFFLSHAHTNYDQVQWLHAFGAELAVHSFGGASQSLQRASPRQWRQELEGMRLALERFAHVDRRNVVGVRAPAFGPAGEVQFREMQVLGYHFDSSQVVSCRDAACHFWPQTLDHRVPWDCSPGQHCPRHRYPGIWAFPISQFRRPREAGQRELFGSTLDAVLRPSDSAGSVARLLWTHFNRSTDANRAPSVIALDSRSLRSVPDAVLLNGLSSFLDEVLRLGDVFVVSMGQTVEWLRRPRKLAKLGGFHGWRCPPTRDRLQPCETPSVCTYPANGTSGPASFRLCGSCPSHYPTLVDPIGSGRERLF